MPGTVGNVLQGPAQVFIADFGSTEPTNAAAAPAVAWTDVGFTDGGATVSIGRTYSKMMVDQVALPVGSRLTEQVVTVATTFAETTLALLRRALNETTAAGTTWELQSAIGNANPNYAAVMLKGLAPTGTPRLVIVRRALSTANVELAFKKDSKTVIPVTFEGYYVSSTVGAIKIDDTPGP